MEYLQGSCLLCDEREREREFDKQKNPLFDFEFELKDDYGKIHAAWIQSQSMYKTKSCVGPHNQLQMKESTERFHMNKATRMRD